MARAVIAGVAFSVIVAAIVLIAAGAWTGVPQ